MATALTVFSGQMGDTILVDKGVNCKCVKVRFSGGMAAGIMVGVTAEMIVCPRPKCRKTAVGQAMQRMGNALDTVMVTVAKKLD